MGPGTDIVTRIQHGHKPIDHDDRVSQYHDIDYLASTNPIDIYAADLKALSRYDKTTLHGLLGSAGMLLKMSIPITSLFLQGAKPQLANDLLNTIGKY